MSKTTNEAKFATQIDLKDDENNEFKHSIGACGVVVRRDPQYQNAGDPTLCIYGQEHRAKPHISQRRLAGFDWPHTSRDEALHVWSRIVDLVIPSQEMFRV